MTRTFINFEPKSATDGNVDVGYEEETTDEKSDFDQGEPFVFDKVPPKSEESQTINIENLIINQPKNTPNKSTSKWHIVYYENSFHNYARSVLS